MISLDQSQYTKSRGHIEVLHIPDIYYFRSLLMLLIQDINISKECIPFSQVPDSNWPFGFSNTQLEHLTTWLSNQYWRKDKQTFGKDLKTDVCFYNLTSFKHFKTASLLTTAYLLYLIDSCSPNTTQSGWREYQREQITTLITKRWLDDSSLRSHWLLWFWW